MPHVGIGSHAIRRTTTTVGSMIQPSDFTFDGAFNVHSDLNFGSGLTGRISGGTTYLYSFASDGTLKEYTVPALLMTAPFNTCSAPTDYGDIFGSVICRAANDGGPHTQPPPNVHGLALCSPGGLFIDPLDPTRCYSITQVQYNNTGDDTNLVISTLDFTAHTGAGVETYKFSRESSAYGTRLGFSVVPIPSSFVSAYGLGSARLAYGGGGNLSVISHKYSVGPCLFAFVPPVTATETNEDYLSTTITPLVHYLSDSYRAPRHSTLPCLQVFPDAFTGTTNYWGWGDAFGPSIGAMWIHGASKQGIAFFAVIGSGFTAAVPTIVNTPSSPTNLVFYVSDATDLRVNDFIGVPTDTTAGHPDYPFCYGPIAGISGNQVTMSVMIDAYTGLVDATGIPTVSASIKHGEFYIGGGTMVSRYVSVMYTYTEAQLGSVTTGTAPNLTPDSYQAFQLGGQAATFTGSGPASQAPPQCFGAWFDDTNRKAYLLYKYMPTSAGFPGGTLLVLRYSVNC